MASTRYLMLGACVAAAGIWAWETDWRPTLPALAQPESGASAPVAAPPAPAPGQVSSAPPPGEPAEPVHTWVDAQGIRHFASAHLAPPGSVPVDPGTTTVIDGYGDALREEQARAAAEQAAAAAPAPDGGPAALVRQLQATLEASRPPSP